MGAVASLSLVLLWVLTGCGSNLDAPAAAELLAEVQAFQYQTQFARAPGYETRKAAVGPHGSEVDIFVNATLQAASQQTGLGEWPDGSLVVKDAYSGSSLAHVAIMKKTAGRWFFAEYSPSGAVLFSGRPTACTGCHSAFQNDSIRAFWLR